MKKILTMVAALLLGLGLSLVATPAQAVTYGWSSQHCTIRSGNGAKICAAVHTVPRGTGLRIDQVQQCNWKIDNTYGNHFRGTKNNYMELNGSSGVFLDSEGLHDISATYDGVCAFVVVAIDGGNGSCFAMKGTQDLALFPDESYSVSGAAIGSGSC